MEMPNVQPATARFRPPWLGKKDKKKDKEAAGAPQQTQKRTTLINWDNLVIGETISGVSAGSGTTVRVVYVDGFQCCMKELDFSIATGQQKVMIRGEIELYAR